MDPVAGLLVVDAANVVGSVPDGWWRDRAGAAARLRDALAPVADGGLPGAQPPVAGPVEVVLVVEGAARAVPSSAHVRVVAAPAAGDDTIVAVARDARGRPLAVVTADRALRARVLAHGATVYGPRVLPRWSSPQESARRGRGVFPGPYPGTRAADMSDSDLKAVPMPDTDAILLGGPRDETLIDAADAALLELEIDGLVHRYIRTTQQRERDGREVTVFNYDGEIDPTGAQSGAETR